MAGIPVYSQAGRNGGWSLIGGARTDLSGLTEAEARTLFLVAGPQAAATPDAKAALRKLVQALPETFRADAEAAASAVMLDPARWGMTPPKPPRFLDDLQRAVVDGVQVEMGYADRERNETERTVHPLGLVAKSSVWYLIGDTAAGLRTFRVNRVRSVTVTDRPVVRPEGFDLAETWERVVATMDERRGAYRVTALVDASAVGWLRGQFGGRLTVREPAEDGRVVVEVGAQSAGAITWEIVGYGDRLEVLDPPEVRDALARIGAQLVARYG